MLSYSPGRVVTIIDHSDPWYTCSLHWHQTHLTLKWTWCVCKGFLQINDYTDLDELPLKNTEPAMASYYRICTYEYPRIPVVTRQKTRFRFFARLQLIMVLPPGFSDVCFSFRCRSPHLSGERSPDSGPEQEVLE